MESLTQPAPAAVPPADLSPRPAQPASPRRRALLLLLAVTASSGLLWLAYFPVNWGWLGWFALVPFLALVRTTARARVVYPLAWVGGLLFYIPALQWMRVADPRMVYTWIALAFYCALYVPLGLFFLRRLDRRTSLPLVLTLPVVWTALEHLRSWLITGFPWYFLGHTQHDVLPLIQFADLTGAYGVSFLVAAVNAVLFEMLYRRQWLRTRFAGPDAAAPGRLAGLLTQAGVVVLALIAAVGYGEWRLGQDAFTPGPRVALIQGSVPQQIRNNVNLVDLMATHYLSLCDLAAAQETRPDLIVWPESSFPGGWYDADPDAAGRLPKGWDDSVKDCRTLFHDKVQVWNTNVLLGLDSGVAAADGRVYTHNSALLLDRDARALGRYDKIHCVPFGEYVPLRDVFPWMRAFAPYDFDYSVTPGRDATHFWMDDGQGRPFSFGVAICYEDTDPDRTRPYTGGDGKAAVDFLLNTSNDGWFDGTSEHDEHLAICRFRAIECRRSVGRAVNMGVTALIDGNGRVMAPQPVEGTEWDRAAVRAVIDGRVERLPADEQKAALDLFPSDHRAAVWLASPSRGGSDLPAARWAEFKKAPFVLLADVPIDHRVSLYSLWGDWLPWVCSVLLAVSFGPPWLRRRPPLPGRG